MQVRQVMTRSVNAVQQGTVSCLQDQDLGQCIQLMQARHVRRIPVVDRHNHLVGLVSLDDLITRAKQEQEIDEALNRVAMAAGCPKSALEKVGLTSALPGRDALAERAPASTP